MFCQNCGKQLPDGAKFCPHCGAALPWAQAAPAQPAAAPAPPPVQQPAQRPTYTAPQSAPQPTYTAPQPTPQPTYTASQSTYTAPQPAARPTPQPVSQPAPQPPTERVGAGILGALLGSLAGVCVMVLLDRVGYVSSLSGILMLGGAVWGYAHFGKALSKKSLVICVPIVLAMVYLGSRICWTITIRGLYTSTVKPDYLSLFLGLPRQLEYTGLMDSYYEYLTQQYAFAAIGIVLLVINVIRSDRAARKNQR